MPFNFSLLKSLAVATLCVTGGAIQAGPIAETAAKIEQQAAAGDTEGALKSAQVLFGQVWEMSTAIGFTQALLVDQPASGFGIYNPRASDVYKPGEKIIIYAEPFGFAYGSPGEGLYSMGFHVDLKVISETGELLGDIPNLTELDLVSRYPNREFQANLTYTLDGIEPGKYLLQTTLRDKNSDRTGSFETKIEIAG